MAQIQKKGIQNNAVDGAKILLLNNQSIRARNFADSADVNLFKLDASNIFQLQSLPQFGGSSLATMADVDTAAEGILPKEAVRLATTAALPACTYNNGTGGVGATLTGNSNGALSSQDGVSPSADDDILVKNQVAALQNGIYTLTVLGDGSNPFVLTRRTDFDNSPSGEIRVGARTFVYDGTLSTGNKFKSFVVTDPGTIIVGTDAIDFVLYSSSETAPVLSVNGFTGAVVLTTTDIAEGTNLYYTAARFNTAFAGKSTTDLAEGTNLYYTAARFNTAFAGKTTTDLTEGSNLYYTAARFNSAFAAKSTSDLSEGSNLYYTNARGIGSVLTGYVSGAGTVAATDTILQAIQKLNGNQVASIIDSIADGDTTHAPSRNAVFDALALKQDAATAVTSVNGQSPVAGAVTITTANISEVTNLYFTEARVRATVLTGFSSGAGTVSATDSVLTAINKLDGNTAAKQATLVEGKEQLTLNGTDITNQYKDLAFIVVPGTLRIMAYGVMQRNGVDYTLSTVSSKTRVTFAGDLATGGNAPLASGDELDAEYAH